MQVQYIKEYSNCLDREMEYKIYGQGGKLCLAIPSQNGRFFEWEDRGMITKVRMLKHELWFEYILTELIPSVQEKINNYDKWMVTGASLGATHAANLIFRFPKQFDTLLALSGIYDTELFYGDYHDENTYHNNPCAYMKNMSLDHPYMELYKQSKLIFCVGQGNWEQECVESLRQFSTILYDQHIEAWCDFWGYDVYHDWPWWKVQLQYFMEQIFKES